MRYFTYAEIIELHVMIIEDFGGLHGIRDEAGLKSLVEAPQMIAFGVEQYVSMYEKAAVYMRNCIADHAFVDGNKRTGVTLAVLFLARNGRELCASPKQLENFAVDVATRHLGVEEIAEWLRCCSSVRK